MTKSNGTVLLVTGLLTAGALLVPAARAAAGYEMESYLDSPGGMEVAAGDYATAITKARSAAARMDSTAALVGATNLCVAYTVTGELEPAAAACERALTLARSADASPGMRRTASTATAKALTNRGVLRAVSGDVARAAADFRKAAELRGAGPAPARNLAHLESLPTDRLAASVD